MNFEIKKVSDIGFCFGVRRAIEMLERTAIEKGKIDSLGAVVHNERVIRKLEKSGVNVIKNPEEIKSNIVAISSHGASPEIETSLRATRVEVLDTTCPFVKRAQLAASQLADAGFQVIIYGDANHPEVKGLLGWAQGKGFAILNSQELNARSDLSLHTGIIAQTTQIPENFILFAGDALKILYRKDAEIRIIDTICPGVRKRQAISLDLARKADLMLVIGGRSSANTRRLAELCSEVTETHLISGAEDLDPLWFENKKLVGITSGTSTPDEVIEEVEKKLREIGSKK
ncbi:MAG: 4-hydroxy-3-methylbut-2-enyl diphosphate reductase [Dehalococcoidales bacterium]|nr:4-hydroxy-3-methylbut-2-enyl diphosphate reductase [Dehalococcoidales bacterium]